jgi:hypothetical protein
MKAVEAKVHTQVRDAVFETNSSSSHSVTVTGEEIVDFGLGQDELREGVIRIERTEGFQWNWERFNDTHSKIAYLLLQCAGGEIEDAEPGMDAVPSLVQESEQARELVDLVHEATGCRVEFYVDGWVSIDPRSAAVGRELFGDPWMMRQFLFSKDSYIETGNDNETPPPGFK